MWNGVFSPNVTKSGMPGEHSQGVMLVSVGEPEYGMVQIYVQFNHKCKWPGESHATPAPSNDTVYTFDYELDSFVSGESEEAADLQTLLDSMSNSDKLKWINENLLDSKE